MEHIKRDESWLARNWKWAVPGGGCLVLIVGLLLFVGTLYFGVTSLLKNSTAYEESLKRANANQQVVEIFGQPIEVDSVGGNVNSTVGSKNANLKIWIKGPKADGKIIVDGTASGNVWTYQKMEVSVEGKNKIINLLAQDKK